MTSTITDNTRSGMRLLLLAMIQPPFSEIQSGVGAGHSFGDMDVYRFQRVIFIRPKENDITQNHE